MPTQQPTTVTWQLLTLTLAANLLILAGLGCNDFKPGEPAPRWTPAQQVYLDNWPTTTEKMQKFLNATTEVVAKTQPDRIVVAQIALQNDLPASEVIRWFMQFPSSSFVTFYFQAGKIGGGFYPLRPETPAKDELLQTLKDVRDRSLLASKRGLDYAKQECLKGDALCDKNLSAAQEAYDAELSRNELFIGGIDLRGPARDLDSILTDPRVFSTQIEPGNLPRGNPFYKDTDVSRWNP